ncbi:hypothetical protein N0V82_009473 [Gnomoniopsis sp. IMI 355080]|nr:hypothetical protein N0V82_009473 [Gnomoniopsis sp. IMI 355080]
MSRSPLILSPALPSELLTYIVQYESHPTTLLICCSRAEFVSNLVSDVQDSLARPDDDNGPSSPNAASTLLSSPLYQVAIARHIRMVFIPTVSHLRAYLSVFNLADSKIPPPPNNVSGTGERQPLLLVYGFLGLHRDTSEWSAQGISATAAALVEAARKNGFGAVVVDAPSTALGKDDGIVDEDAVSRTQRTMLEEEVPLLSASGVRAGADFEDAAWTGRRVSVDRVLGRWFQHKEGDWSKKSRESKETVS